MRKPSSKNAPQTEAQSTAADTEALFASLAKAEEMEDEPVRYASPPCYLAEFSDAERTEHAAK